MSQRMSTHERNYLLRAHYTVMFDAIVWDTMKRVFEKLLSWSDNFILVAQEMRFVRSKTKEHG